MPYVDGFVIPVPKDKVEAYRKLAERASQIWKQHGALEYYECVGDDMDVADQVPFPVLANAKPDETVFFSFILYPSKEARNKANEAIMSDPAIKEMCEECGQIFDCKRMAYGGFQTLVKI